MKLYLKDTIFKIYVWNIESVKKICWYNIDIPTYLKNMLNYYMEAECKVENSEYKGVSVAINEDLSNEELNIFDQYFRYKIYSPTTGKKLISFDDVIDEINYVKANAYIDIAEEELLYLKLKYSEIFKG